jgi:very-short-patch-repair endonuclease
MCGTVGGGASELSEGSGLRSAIRLSDVLQMDQLELPPLTGSALFDPWRLRYRRVLQEQGVEVHDRRPTKSELMLWEQLRGSSSEWFAEVPTKYGYTLDFYCPAVRLAVEVDGASHWGKAAADHDAKRDAAHERMGIRTKRFSAREVETEVLWVVAETRLWWGSGRHSSLLPRLTR